MLTIWNSAGFKKLVVNSIQNEENGGGGAIWGEERSGHCAYFLDAHRLLLPSFVPYVSGYTHTHTSDPNASGFLQKEKPKL